MAWKQEIYESITTAINVPFVAGTVATIATSLISTYRRYPKMKRLARWAEALSCALISTALTNAGILYFGISEQWGISIGVFIGWIGTNELKLLLQRVISKYLPAKEEAKNTDDR